MKNTDVVRPITSRSLSRLTTSLMPKSKVSRPSIRVIPAAAASGACVPYREYGDRVVGSGSGPSPGPIGRLLTGRAYSVQACDQRDGDGGLSSGAGLATIQCVRRSI